MKKTFLALGALVLGTAILAGCSFLAEYKPGEYAEFKNVVYLGTRPAGETLLMWATGDPSSREAITVIRAYPKSPEYLETTFQYFSTSKWGQEFKDQRFDISVKVTENSYQESGHGHIIVTAELLWIASGDKFWNPTQTHELIQSIREFRETILQNYLWNDETHVNIFGEQLDRALNILHSGYYYTLTRAGSNSYHINPEIGLATGSAIEAFLDDALSPTGVDAQYLPDVYWEWSFEERVHNALNLDKLEDQQRAEEAVRFLSPLYPHPIARVEILTRTVDGAMGTQWERESVLAVQDFLGNWYAIVPR